MAWRLLYRCLTVLCHYSKTLRMAKTKPKTNPKYMKTMIYLDPALHSRLRHISVDERISMAELIRRAVTDYLKRRKVGR